ncbi:hypothetical protein FSP39_008898 [Pinctada imbricata]|uniref:Transposase n=1 Tax=Pinctada imbricata TaxID=66713 RepID=A0AA88YSI3_PINIB|nr:hypothetical protein FSP39_008898 [Pinctada imbricata]
MPRLRKNQRHEAKGMLAAGLSARQIARQMACSPSTFNRLAQRIALTGSVDDRPRPGRTRVTSPNQDRLIQLRHLRDRFLTAAQTAQSLQGVVGRRLSASTVRRRLRSIGLHSRRPFRGNNLTAIRRHNRLQWTQRRQRWSQRQWAEVLFTDESRFQLSGSDGRIRVWRRRGERYADCCVREADKRGGGSVMVWGGISFRHRTSLIVIDGTLTAQRYINEVLRPAVVPFFAAHRDVTQFQQDNARPHSARLTAAFLRQQRIDTLPWPAFSPDLSPIEHLWDQLGKAVRQRHPQPQTLRQLEAALQAE